MISRFMTLPPVVRSLAITGASATVIASSFLADVEGTKYEAYQDTGKVWTICNGHTAGVKPHDTASPALCDDLLRAETEKFTAAVTAMVTVPMPETRRAALTSFCYNVGIAACKRSTLIKKINKKDPAACAELSRWVYVAGKDCRNPLSKCGGIVKRRAQERALCEMDGKNYVVSR